MSDKIQMVDLHAQYLKLQDEMDRAIRSVIDSTAFVKGPKVTEFQTHLEQYLGVRHVIPVANGTEAIQIALMSLGLQPGDEVITPTFTFIATAEVVALLGLKPVVVDVDPDTFCMTVEQVAKAITPKTKAIVPVNLFGQNAPLEDLKALADEHHLFLVEDACQSMGAHYIFRDGRRVASGTVGIIGCTSFFPSKNLGCYGDGGALFTNDDLLAEKARSIANHGMTIRYHHDRIGVNSRLDAIQAAVLDVKLPHLDDYIRARQYAASFYNEAFRSLSWVRIPSVAPYTTHAFHQYTLVLSDDIDRDALQSYLKEKGIPSMVYYPIPLHLQKAYRDPRYREGDFPVAEHLASHVISLPMHTELDDEQLRYITDTFKSFVS
ncbi:MAG: DegT/DnrJ/EryC1/StrS family aminotransferase [Paludibacteraceae bacterium]|nr:DegT/DnrJ/EryC1/StrS family aminotransferase [Paludibacteraceae bacterium]